MQYLSMFSHNPPILNLIAFVIFAGIVSMNSALQKNFLYEDIFQVKCFSLGLFAMLPGPEWISCFCLRVFIMIYILVVSVTMPFFPVFARFWCLFCVYDANVTLCFFFFSCLIGYSLLSVKVYQWRIRLRLFCSN